RDAPGRDPGRRHSRRDQAERAGDDDADRHRRDGVSSQLLELAAVDTYRGAAHVLRAVSLAVNEGETVCLVGRNGAGKTTTLETAIGLLPVRSGVIRLRGQEITRTPTHRSEERRVGKEGRCRGSTAMVKK